MATDGNYTERITVNALGGVSLAPTVTAGAMPAEVVAAPGMPGSSITNLLVVSPDLVLETNRLLRKLIAGLEQEYGREFLEVD